MSNRWPLLRQTLRALRRAPGYAVAACLTLAVGLVAALAALAPTWDLLAMPFELRDAGRIVSLSGEGAGGASFLSPVSFPDFQDLARELRHVEGLAACRDAGPLVDFADGPRQVRTGLVSPGFFQVMGMPLRLGRDFEARETEGRGARVLILEHGFWLRRFGGDPQILGRTLDLDGMPWQIVGVLAPQQRLPFFLDDAIAFQPLVLQGGDRRREVACCWLFGRLAEGSSLGQLQAEVARLVPQLGPARPSGDPAWGIRVRGLVAYWRGRVAPELALPLAAGLLILLLACANVAHLMLARHLGRTREWGLRAALGAGRGGLKAPLLMEAALLILAASALAALALLGLHRSGALPEGMLRGSVWVPVALTLVAALGATALLPLRWAGRLDLNEALREGGAASASRGSNRLRGGLAVFQLALAFALLVGAGLGLQALERLQGVNPGYDLKQLQVAILLLEMRPGEDFRARSAAFQRQVCQSLAQVPGVEGVALSNTRPLVDQGNGWQIWPEGQGAIQADQHGISPEYLRTLRLPLLAGRNLEDDEAGVCLVSASLARRCWGEASPLGRRLRIESVEGQALTVVGVVGEARMSRLAKFAVPTFYTALAREGSSFLTVYVRSGATIEALRAHVQEAARQAESSARFLELQSLETLAARELEGPRALRRMTLGAAVLAAFLAGIGLAGTLAQAAARQRREWAIRSALGASPLALVGLVFRRVLSLLALGLTLGSGLAWVLGRVLQQQLQDVSPADPGLLAFALLGLGLTGLLAGLIPALRAARVNPAEALRSE
ncbi:ABC transporter permease [Geothrix sp. PMB-07]|uniref:ABC transporter permease n=1 Tax=Geothrix sp. PMB-07 TaxID=3068640 RepID=UPI0027416389|nr:ABC transporter permease [Geothrix sp. PMB-07]WLT31887.1 ABC transporter permease [Geothrix sp. PMB-07]